MPVSGGRLAALKHNEVSARDSEPVASSVVAPDTWLAVPLRRSTDDAKTGASTAARRGINARPGLVVGGAADPEEVRADRVADSVMRRLARGRDDSPGAPNDGALPGVPPVPAMRRSAPQRGVAGSVGREGGALGEGMSAEITSRLGGGSPIPAPLRRSMEGAFGRDFGGVRLHTDEHAARLSDQVSARAFTLGRDVFFGAGEYRPDTAEGQHTIAHELAHTGEESVRRVHRLWNMKAGAPVGIAENATEMTTVGSRNVWFVSDGQDKIVVKLEDQPVGLNLLATEVLGRTTNARTVAMKKLPTAERKAVRDMIEQGRITRGDGWQKANADNSNDALKKENFNGDLNAWGRATHVATIDELNGVPMVAMTLAAGKTADDLRNPELDYDRAGTAPIKKVLSERAMVRQLGELSAVDLFLGNGDRVLSGNLGNWFYTPQREMTVIDNVDARTKQQMNLNMPDSKEQDAEERLGKKKVRSARDTLDLLSSDVLEHTAVRLVNGIANSVRASFEGLKANSPEKVAWDKWLAPLRPAIEANMLDGLIAGRKRIVKTMMSKRTRDRSLRSAKKAIKAQAASSMVEDATTAQDDYYTILKARAKWLAKN